MSVESYETVVFTDDDVQDGAGAEPIIIEATDVGAPVGEQRLPGMMKYGAACSNSYVSRVVFGPSDIKLKMDTFETIKVPQDAEYLGYLAPDIGNRDYNSNT